MVAVILAGVGTVGYLTVQRQVSTPAPAVDVPNAVTPVSRSAPAHTPTTGSEVVAPLPVVNDQTETPASPKARNTPRTRGKHREIARRPAALPAPEPAPEPERAPTEGVSADEFALLRAARQAVASHPVRALGLTEEHAQRFPTGMLAQEREAIAIEALANLGREAQAQSRAQMFLKAHPGSPYKPRIDAALARMSGSRLPP